MFTARTLTDTLKPYLPDIKFFTDKDRRFHMDVYWLEYCCSSVIEDINDHKQMRYMVVRSIIELCKRIVEDEDKIMSELQEN